MGRNIAYLLLVAVCGYILYNTFSLEPFNVKELNLACLQNSRNVQSIKTTDKNLSNKIIITRLAYVYPVDKVQVQQKIRFGQRYFEDEKSENFLTYTTKQYDKNYAKEVFTHWLYRKDEKYSYFFNKTTADEMQPADKGKFKRRFLKMPENELDELVSRACHR